MRDYEENVLSLLGKISKGALIAEIEEKEGQIAELNRQILAFNLQLRNFQAEQPKQVEETNKQIRTLNLLDRQLSYERTRRMKAETLLSWVKEKIETQSMTPIAATSFFEQVKVWWTELESLVKEQESTPS